MQIPQGFIDAALDAVRLEVTGHLRSGTLLDDDYYFSIAAASLWYCYVEWKDTESDLDRCLRLRDIEAGCHSRGIPCRMDHFELHISMPEHGFMFCDSNPGGYIYGGPCDSHGYYQGYNRPESPLAMSTRTFFRLMAMVDSVLDELRTPVSKHVREVCLQYQTAEVAGTTVRVLFEPGMEDLCYRYGVSSDDNGESVDVWLFCNEESASVEYRHMCIHFRFGMDDFMARMDLIKKILHIIEKDFSKWEGYSMSFQVEALDELISDVPDRPCAGFPRIL